MIDFLIYFFVGLQIFKYGKSINSNIRECIDIKNIIFRINNAKDFIAPPGVSKEEIIKNLHSSKLTYILNIITDFLFCIITCVLIIIMWVGLKAK